jgi:hypothetical protein
MEKAPLVALLTDFGTSDPFAGIMKGVIASIAPGIQIVDLTHEIPPGDVQRGAVALWQAMMYFPPGTIFLGVVDPEVGTFRRPVLVESENRTFIGPDNGLFSFVLGGDYQAWELRNPRLALPSPGNTFHGRDIFAPAAAHAASGIPGSEFGPAAAPLSRLPAPLLDSSASQMLRGEVLFPDRFGNLLTSLGQFVPLAGGTYELQPWLRAGSATNKAGQEKRLLRFHPAFTRLYLPGGESLQWVTTFAEAPPGGCAFLVGSSGLLEIVAFQRSAAEILGLRSGNEITLRSLGEP